MKKSLTTVAMAAIALTTSSAAVPTVAAAAATGCAALTEGVQQAVDPTTGINRLTLGAAPGAADPVFSDQRGVMFKASSQPVDDDAIVAVHRLRKPATGDLVWIGNPREVTSAVNKYGYVDEGVQFHASSVPGPGCEPIHRLLKGAFHTFARASEVPGLEADGWRNEGARFYGAPPQSDTVFSFVVLPDTQTWTLGDTRFSDATAWIVSQQQELNIQWVLHTGDFVNWGWLDDSQYVLANRAMKNLQDAGIPYGVSIGNHDTRVVGVGGKSFAEQNDRQDCVAMFGELGCRAGVLSRQTQEFNANQTASMFTRVTHEFEPGKVDNIVQTFTAGGKSWMVLTLELDARAEVVDWANGIIAANPTSNVIVQTHNYLTGTGQISGPVGYGSTSPQYVFDNLISKHPNIKMVFSGHQGAASYRTDTVNGNKVYSFLMNILGTGNALRVVTVDTATGTITSNIYNQSQNTWSTRYAVTGAISVI